MSTLSKRKQSAKKMPCSCSRTILSRWRLSKIRCKTGDHCTVYKCGSFVDLCQGPHIPHMGYVNAFKVTNNSSSYFLGNPQNDDQLQRVYRISFPTKKELSSHLTHMEEIKERDHRKIGADQKLFFFDDSSPGSCYFLPHGQRIYQKLIQLIESLCQSSNDQNFHF
jgi:threonyl-tRNA synthetase